GPEGPELHPLVREYLFTKLGERSDTPQRVQGALLTALDQGNWDHAFGLIERFAVLGSIDDLLTRSFRALLSSGRIATLERIAKFAHESKAGNTPLVALVDAELTFRAGAFARTQAIATRAAVMLGDEHPLSSHAWWIAGQAAQLSFDDSKATHHFGRARE